MTPLLRSNTGSKLMSTQVIIWDLETVPDLGGFAAANGLVGKAEAEIREVLGKKFPKHIYHSIACIGALVAHKDGDRWVDESGFGASERDLTEFIKRHEDAKAAIERADSKSNS